VDKIPDADEIRQYKTSHLDAQIAAAFQAVDKLKESPNAATVEGRNRTMWHEYRNLLLRIADTRSGSRFYHWFDENTLDETAG
jgi:hypothetical protein